MLTFQTLAMIDYDPVTDRLLAHDVIVSDSEWLAAWSIDYWDNRPWPTQRYAPVMPGTHVDGYVSMGEIMSAWSLDVTSYWGSDVADAWQNVMEGKRGDASYRRIVRDLENGWGLRHAVGWTGKLGNGHHRVTAAFDMGYTHMPVVFDNWTDTGADDYDG